MLLLDFLADLGSWLWCERGSYIGGQAVVYAIPRLRGCSVRIVPARGPWIGCFMGPDAVHTHNLW